VLFFCCGLPLVVTALMMGGYMAASSPECGHALWVLGCAVLGTVVLGGGGLGLLFQARGEQAPALDAVQEVKEIEALEEKLRRLWRQGGFLAKPQADRDAMIASIRAALARVPTRDLAQAHVCRWFLHAVKHVVEECRVLPMRSTHVEYPMPVLEVFGKDDEPDKEGLEWLAGVELLQEGYVHDDLQLVCGCLTWGRGRASRCCDPASSSRRGRRATWRR